MAESLCYSRGNTKLGTIANLSFTPFASCDCTIGCARKGQCYAFKVISQYSKQAAAAWARNLRLWREDPESFKIQLFTNLILDQSGWFRFFVGGDCPDPTFVDLIFETAAQYPNKRILVFTKRYAWMNAALETRTRPANLAILFSAWKGTDFENPHGLPIAWVRDPKDLDPRIPTDRIMECPGNCQSCAACWNLPALGVDVVFPKH
jgi:hypothetical protein